MRETGGMTKPKPALPQVELVRRHRRPAQARVFADWLRRFQTTPRSAAGRSLKVQILYRCAAAKMRCLKSFEDPDRQPPNSISAPIMSRFNALGTAKIVRLA